jgi:hypothetical protein
MKAAKTQHEWMKFLTFFGEQHSGRPTRIGVFERNGDAVNDYWLENGLPLVGIDIDTKKELPAVQITVGSFTHEVNDAVKLLFHFTRSGDEDGLDISTASGQTTILRFENPNLSA